jgi:acetolactate synthase-1/2/3 large subunit
MTLHGGDRVAEVLKGYGVPFVFTLIGGHISPILVGCKTRGIRIVDVRHEVNTVFAADAVARLTGVPGVAVVTAGPGVTNTITAIKNAQLAQSPLVLLGGATATMLRGRGSLQDIDQVALIKPHVKWVGRPNTMREVVPALHEAFRRAQEGTPGPVFVELAVDLLYSEETVREMYRKTTDKPNKTLGEKVVAWWVQRHLNRLFREPAAPDMAPRPKPTPPQASDRLIQRAASMLQEAERPLLVLGSQALLRPARTQELVDALEALNIPVYLSGMGRGLLGSDHPLQMRHKRRNALKEADVVMLAGVPMDFRLDYGSHVARAKVISVNLSKHDLRKNRRPTLGLLADPLDTLVRIAGKGASSTSNRGLWWATLRERDAARNAEIGAMAASKVDGINPMALCQHIDPHLTEASVLVGDGGDFVATASYIVQPRGPLTWLDPGVFGTLGVGAGFALGAKLVKPDADIWLMWGDGAAGFSLIEFDTFARHGLSVIGVVGNDAGWTQIERDQVEILGDDVGCRLANTDYDVIAKGCGGHGIRVDRVEDVDAALQEALKKSREGVPTLLNVTIGKTDFRKGSISM